MSAESTFKENCGPDVEFVSTEMFDRGRRLEFAFNACGRFKVFGVKLVDETGQRVVTEDAAGREAAKLAREWVEERKRR